MIFFVTRACNIVYKNVNAPLSDMTQASLYMNLSHQVHELVCFEPIVSESSMIS